MAMPSLSDAISLTSYLNLTSMVALAGATQDALAPDHDPYPLAMDRTLHFTLFEQQPI